MTKQPNWMKQREMTREQYLKAIDTLCFTQVAAGAFLGYAPRTAARLASGDRLALPAEAMLLRMMIAEGVAPEGVRAIRSDGKWRFERE